MGVRRTVAGKPYCGVEGIGVRLMVRCTVVESLVEEESNLVEFGGFELADGKGSPMREWASDLSGLTPPLMTTSCLLRFKCSLL
jgi:hypothetical protein